MDEVEHRRSDLLRLLLKRWWVLVLGVVVGGLLGFAALQVIQPTYSTTATQLIKGVPGAGTGANYLAAQFAVARAKSYPAFIYSSRGAGRRALRSGPAVHRRPAARAVVGEQSHRHPAGPGDARPDATAKEAQDLANSASRHLARFITQIETVDGSTPVIVETAVQAGLPSQPSEPQPGLLIALGMTGGFAVAVIVVLGLGLSQSTTPQGCRGADRICGTTRPRPRPDRRARRAGQLVGIGRPTRPAPATRELGSAGTRSADS